MIEPRSLDEIMARVDPESAKQATVQQRERLMLELVQTVVAYRLDLANPHIHDDKKPAILQPLVDRMRVLDWAITHCDLRTKAIEEAATMPLELMDPTLSPNGTPS